MTFLKRRVSAAVWELLLVLVAAIIFATVYRIYFSRAVALTQVCERFSELQERRSRGYVQQWATPATRSTTSTGCASYAGR